MSPHKPDPIPRKVDVDISSILIRSEELDRLGAKYQHELANALPGGGRDPANNARFSPISSSEWASITFAVGACVIGIVCTFWTFDDLDQLTRLVYPAPDAIYVRPQLRIGKLSNVGSPRADRPLPTQSSEPAASGFKETTAPSDQAPPLSMFSPIFENNGWPLLSSGGSVAGSSPGQLNQPTGIARSSMSESDGSVAQGRNVGQKLRFKQLGNLTRRASKSIAANETLSARQIFANRFGQASIQKARTSATALNRATMSMHSQQNGAPMLQNRVGLNSMHMQHGMGAVSAIPGLNGGLNGAGLGGNISGGGHHGRNGRR